MEKDCNGPEKECGRIKSEGQQERGGFSRNANVEEKLGRLPDILNEARCLGVSSPASVNALAT